MLRRRSMGAVAAAMLLGATAVPALAQDGEREPLDIILVSHSPVTESFWLVADNGLRQAGEDLGVNVEYRGVTENLQDPNEQRRLIEAAIASEPDGLIVTNPYPDSLDPVIRSAVEAGIPTVQINSGFSSARDNGVLAYVGNDERATGTEGARLMDELGCTKALLVTITEGALPLADDRADGFVEGFPGETVVTEIPLSNLSDATRIKNALETDLQRDESIECVFSIGQVFSPPMIETRSELGERGESMRWGTQDLGTPVLDALKSGAMDFALDQQQYNQGYLPVLILSQYIRLGIEPGSFLVPTGPGVITSENVDRLIDLQAQQVR